MKAYPLYIFDLDGTLFRGEEPTPNAVRTVRELRRRGAIIRFLTNNSSKTIQFLTEKLQRLGFEAASEEVMTTAIRLIYAQTTSAASAQVMTRATPQDSVPMRLAVSEGLTIAAIRYG